MFFSPIVLILYWKNKLWGYICCLVLFFINWLTVGIQSNIHDWNPSYMFGMLREEQFLNNYVKPYARMAPYVLGMMVGFMYRSVVDSKPPAAPKEPMSVELNPEYNLIQEEAPKARVDRNPITYLEIKALRWVHIPIARYIGYCVGFVLMCVINFG